MPEDQPAPPPPSPPTTSPPVETDTDAPRQAVAHTGTKLLVCGNSGTGKTTFSLRYLVGTDAARVFVFDHEGEIWQRLGVRPALTFEELKTSLLEDRIVIFDPAVEFPGDKPGAFAYFCELCFQLSQTFAGRKLLVTDEIQKFTDTDNVDASFATVLETGRRAELDLLAITRAPNLLHNRVRNELTEVVSFRLIDPRAGEFLRVVGLDLEQVRQLPRGHYLARDLDTGVVSAGRVF